MGSIPRFETERLVLAEVLDAECESYHQHIADWEVVQHLSSAVPWPYPADGVIGFLEERVRPRLGVSRWLWGIREKTNPTIVIGAVDLWRPGVPEHRGFWLGKAFWGKGYMTEAVEATTRYAFEAIGFDELVFSNAVGNIRSRRVKERTGATWLRNEPAPFHRADYTEHELWRLTKADWLALE